jgi:hypothetical protein
MPAEKQSMTTVEMTVHVDPNGILHLEVPLGSDAANQEVKVTIKPARMPPKTMEEWRKFIADTAGSIADPTFIRHPQGELENLEGMFP